MEHLNTDLLEFELGDTPDGDKYVFMQYDFGQNSPSPITGTFGWLSKNAVIVDKRTGESRDASEEDKSGYQRLFETIS